ncbi:MAG: ECF transporter S component [Clostridia bacterium]|nr:ECF transporter S component [Clostridia bacterium]
MAILVAIIIVLQVLSNFIKFGQVQITLALAPIIVGAALYGVGAGALLGLVLGVVILVSGLIGIDGGFMLLLLGANPVFAVIVCLGKSTVAGLLAGLVYKLIAKKNDLAAVIVAGVVCPVTNTGLFLVGMFAFFMPLLENFAAGQNVLTFAIVGLVGINFLIEFAVNLVLSSAISRIIKTVKK